MSRAFDKYLGQAYRAALEDAVKLAEEKFSRAIDVNNDEEVCDTGLVCGRPVNCTFQVISI